MCFYNSLELYLLDINKPIHTNIDNDTKYNTYICSYIFLEEMLCREESRFHEFLRRHKAEV